MIAAEKCFTRWLVVSLILDAAWLMAFGWADFVASNWWKGALVALAAITPWLLIYKFKKQPV